MARKKGTSRIVLTRDQSNLLMVRVLPNGELRCFRQLNTNLTHPPAGTGIKTLYKNSSRKGKIIFAASGSEIPRKETTSGGGGGHQPSLPIKLSPAKKRLGSEKSSRKRHRRGGISPHGSGGGH
jgi:hypothetical protein